MVVWLVKAKGSGCGGWRWRCAGLHLMSHEIHDPVALNQLPPVRAVCKHRGWT